MTPELLEEIGLNKTQAKVYLILIENGTLTPLEVANKAHEKRTNAYMVLDQLASMGLVRKVTDKGKKVSYEAENPVALEKLTEAKRKRVHQAEMKVKQAMPALLSYYYSFTEKPGIRLVEGVDGLREVYADTLRAKKDIFLLRSTADTSVMTNEYLDRYREKRANLGIHTYALTPDTPASRETQAEGVDEKMLFHRTFLPKDSYTAPVEMDVYGDRTAFIVFGEEVMGVVVDNKPLAEAMRQVFRLLSEQLNAADASAPRLVARSSEQA